MRVWEGRGRGSSVHVYRTCRRISRYGFCLSGGGVGLESRMTSCYLIKLTGCSSDVFETPLKGKKISFHRRGLQVDTSSAEEATLLCGNNVRSFPQSCTYAMIGLYWFHRNHCWIYIVFFLWVSFKVFLIFCVTSFDDRTQPQHKETTMMMSIFSFMLCFSN